MLLTMETGTRVEFLNPGIVKMMLNEEHVLTAQLMREVQVSFKVKTGTAARAFMFYINGRVSQPWVDALLRKTDRISQQMPVALIFESQSHHTFTTHSAFRVFSNFPEALDWLTFYSDNATVKAADVVFTNSGLQAQLK